MKNLRLFLWIALGMILLVNYQTWQLDYAARDAAAAEAARVAAAANPPPSLGNAIPQAGAANAPAAAGATAPVPQAAPTPGAATQPDAAAAAAPALLRVKTDVLDLDISLVGGELRRADLLQYPVVKGQPEVVRLLRAQGPGDEYVLQSGLAGAGAVPAGSYPTHVETFTSDFAGFELQDGADELRVPLKWSSAEGVNVTKTFVFHRGSYRIDIEYRVDNGSPAAWQVAPYMQILHDMPPVTRSYFNVNSYAFTGPALWDGGKYQKLKIASQDDASLNREITGGWMASLQHHFVAAMVPKTAERARYTLRVRGNEYLATIVGPTQSIDAGSSHTIGETVFVGPKLQKQLESIHPELSRAADYGKLTFLAKPLFWLLQKAHQLFNNWGLAIIAVTFLLKLAFYPLSEASGRSMAKMKLISPRMKQLQETYKDDREKLGRAMMEMYKKEKINPASGCLPMLVQLPVFLAFYWVLLESVEMRQAPFFGWLQDLSTRDPFFILPLIMAGAMFLQYKLQPTPADPVQAKVFMILPLVMSVTFAFFPSGLVLYWVTNTILTIAQQWNINRRIEASNARRN
ncbi:MAG: membrane protein insertase YidC [Steroidobacteraceae bacterium]